MAHRTFYGGSGWNIVGGRILDNEATGRNIIGGRTFYQGTGWNISFTPPFNIDMLEPFAYDQVTVLNQTKYMITRWLGKSVGDYGPMVNIPNYPEVQLNVTTFMSSLTTNYPYEVIIPEQIDLVPYTTAKSVFANFFARSPYLKVAKICHGNITTMAGTFTNCRNLISIGPIGRNVTTMVGMCADCRNLVGPAVSGANVLLMSRAYYNCVNLTGLPACGPKVTTMTATYAGCSNLSAGTSYFYSPNISNVAGCFFEKNNSRRYNIHVPAGSTTLNTIYSVTDNNSIVGAPITWTNNGVNFFNEAYNIYIYANSSM